MREALAGDGVVEELFAVPDAQQRYGDLIALAQHGDVPVSWVSPEVMSGLAQTVTPQGVVAVCRFIDVPLPARPMVDLVVVLSHVRDPGNAGTVLRTADAAGAGLVVFTDASVDPYNGKCVRASAGSLFHVPVVMGCPLDEAAAGLRAAGHRVLGADHAGVADLDREAESGALRAPIAWVFGNEAWGLPDSARAMCDDIVSVPIYGEAESLNLATAAAVCLYATAREQRRPS